MNVVVSPCMRRAGLAVLHNLTQHEPADNQHMQDVSLACANVRVVIIQQHHSRKLRLCSDERPCPEHGLPPPRPPAYVAGTVHYIVSRISEFVCSNHTTTS